MVGLVIFFRSLPNIILLQSMRSYNFIFFVCFIFYVKEQLNKLITLVPAFCRYLDGVLDSYPKEWLPPASNHFVLALMFVISVLVRVGS